MKVFLFPYKIQCWDRQDSKNTVHAADPRSVCSASYRVSLDGQQRSDAGCGYWTRSFGLGQNSPRAITVAAPQAPTK